VFVQRDEVWDVERMGRLLDSLLVGYPAGALLLCRTDKVASNVIDRDEAAETVRAAPAGAYRLLDGQQRLNALYTMLTAPDEKHRKFAAGISRTTDAPPAAGARRAGDDGRRGARPDGIGGDFGAASTPASCGRPDAVREAAGGGIRVLSTPACRRFIAAVCLSVCGETVLLVRAVQVWLGGGGVLGWDTFQPAQVVQFSTALDTGHAPLPDQRQARCPRASLAA
jgi:hypothetical protein